MVSGYSSASPNPDILCNRSMKFGALLDLALEQGFDGIATGHYCRRLLGPMETLSWEGWTRTDQSYFLARITQFQLNHARFPLGEIDKGQVRTCPGMAFAVAEKDSQGICFLGKVKVPEFLSNFIDDQPGEIITQDGRVLGSHRGLHRYTWPKAWHEFPPTEIMRIMW